MTTNQSQVQSENSEEISVSDVIDKYLPYWPWILLLVAFAVSGAWFYLRYKNPVYRTTASILIKDDKKGTGALDPLEAFDLFGGKKSVENEVEILQSKTLMQEVVENLHLYAPITVKGRVRSGNAYSSSPIVIEAQFTDSIQKVQDVSFDFDATLSAVVIGKNKYPLNAWVNTEFGSLRFVPNENYKVNSGQENVLQYSFSLNSVKNTANQVLQSLTVSPSSKMSTVINIGIDGEVPERDEDILNELLKVYNQAAIKDKNILAASTIKFVDDRLSYVVHELDSVEASLQRFRAQNKLTDISAQGQIFLQSISENDKKVNEIETQLAVLDQIDLYVRSKQNIGGIVPSTLGVSDPTLIELLQRLNDLELLYEQKKVVIPAKNPEMIALRESIEKLRPAINENISNQKKNLQAARRDLNRAGEKYSAILNTIPQKERELLSISRQQSIKNEIYTFLLKKREETALSLASSVADTRVVDLPETADIPVSPKRNLIFLSAFLGAFALGIAVIYLKDLLTRTVQSRAEVEKATNIPILGEVAFDTHKTPIVILEGRRSFIAEQFRQLRTSLSYLGEHKRIMITSSISGEGKSFIAINLGISLSLTNKKVAVLELDLRKPKLSEVFQISRAIGITNYLVEKKALPDILRKTSFENLALVPSGPIPPNPSELISNGKLEKLLEELEEKFDYIIIDTAPTNPVTDAFLVSPLADVSIYLVRHNYTPKIFLSKLRQYKETGKLKNPTIVYNGVRGKGVAKYGYGYGYGYGYTEEKMPWWKKITRS